MRTRPTGRRQPGRRHLSRAGRRHRTVAEAVNLAGPAGQEGQYRRAAGGAARRVVLHVVVDRAAGEHAERAGAGGRVVRGSRAFAAGGSRLDLVGGTAARRLQALVDRNQPPAQAGDGGDPGRRELRLGATPVHSADVDAKRAIRRGTPGGDCAQRRRRAGVERRPGVAGRARVTGGHGRSRHGRSRHGRGAEPGEPEQQPGGSSDSDDDAESSATSHVDMVHIQRAPAIGLEPITCRLTAGRSAD